MSHPHIVRFLGAFMQSGAEPALCILLEFAAGGTLREDIRRQRETGRSYDSDDVIMWMTQLVTAVSYMHGRNVLHRDLSSGEYKWNFLCRSEMLGGARVRKSVCALFIGLLIARACSQS